LAPFDMGLCPCSVKRPTRPKFPAQRKRRTFAYRRVGRRSLRPAEPRLVARVQFSRVRGAVAMDDRRERASGGVDAGGHVAVSLRIAREVARREQLVESFRRLDRGEPGALVDGGALPNGPTPPASLPPVEEARIRR